MAVSVHAKVVLAGASGPQKINNIIYYRHASADADAELMAQIIGGALVSAFVPVWLDCMSVHYLLHTLNIELFDGLWAPLLFLPHQTPVEAVGTVGGNLAGPAQCAIIKFVLNPTTLLLPTLTKRPKRSYIAMGPIPETAVQDTGEFDGTPYASGNLNELLGMLANSIDTGDDPGELLPERVGVANEVGQHASMLVTSAAFRAKASFRRSRNN